MSRRPRSNEVGQELTAEIFADGSYVDVTGTSRARGFAGTMKRHGFRGQGANHGAQAVHRRPGSIGGCATPAVSSGHPDVGPDGQRQGHHAEPEGAQGGRRERRAADQGAIPSRNGGLVRGSHLRSKGEK